MAKRGYKRVLLKLSGEVFSGASSGVFDEKESRKIAAAIIALRKQGLQLAIVIGGGNIFRGSLSSTFGFSRISADQMGMLATGINGLALQELLLALGQKSHLLSAVDCHPFFEKFSVEKALSYLEETGVVIFVGGTGHPFFTTDTAAALRAAEIEAELLCKATKVDGVYDKDPLKHKGAKKFDTLTYTDILKKNLQVMDHTAITLCQENQIPIRVVKLEQDSLLRALCEKKGGTFIEGE